MPIRILILLLIIGYLTMTRSFAYLGVPPINLFIGEAALMAILVLRPKMILGHWGNGLVEKSPVSGLSWSLYLFIAYGVLLVLRGISNGYPVIDALQNLAYNYYPLCLFIGLAAGLRFPGLLQTTMRVLAWANGLYGAAYILVLNRISIDLPGITGAAVFGESGGGIPLFGAPAGSAIALLGLIAFEKNLARAWPLLALNMFVLIGMVVRAEWFGFLVAVALWTLLTGRIVRVLQFVVAAVTLFAVGLAADFSIPAPVQRGGVLSVREIFARMVAPLDRELAQQYSDHATMYSGTVSWRTEWWQAIWSSVHSDWITTWFGHGYGYPLVNLVPYLEGANIRTPHNVFLYALGYGGWLGLALFVVLQLVLVRLLWNAWRITGQPIGLMFWAFALTKATFDNFFETPFGAIPTYLLVGLAIAPAIAHAFKNPEITSRGLAKGVHPRLWLPGPLDIPKPAAALASSSGSDRVDDRIGGDVHRPVGFRKFR